MALTSDEITYIRAMTSASTSDVSDTLLNYFYANQAAEDVDKTIVYTLRTLLAKAYPEVSTSNNRTGDVKAFNQKFEHLKDMLATWQALTGLLPEATIGSLNLGIDEEDSTFNIT